MANKKIDYHLILVNLITSVICAEHSGDVWRDVIRAAKQMKVIDEYISPEKHGRGLLEKLLRADYSEKFGIEEERKIYGK